MDVILLMSTRNVIWAATSNQINRWRRNLLKLENTDMGHLAQSKITFIYNFSKVSTFWCYRRVMKLQFFLGGRSQTVGLAGHNYRFWIVS